MSAVLIVSTAGSRAEAEAIATALVTERLAACVQLEAIDSCYRWQDAIEWSPEIRLQIKTMANSADAVVARVRELHGYDLPEVVVVPVIGGSADYLAWVEEQTRSC